MIQDVPYSADMYILRKHGVGECSDCGAAGTYLICIKDFVVHGEDIAMVCLTSDCKPSIRLFMSYHRMRAARTVLLR